MNPTAEQNTIEAVREFLSHCPRTEVIADGVLTIGKTRWPGCEYRQMVDILPGCPAYDRGERTYVNHMIYAIGPIPAGHRQRKAKAYRLQDGRLVWIAAWLQNIELLQDVQHPMHACDKSGTAMRNVLFTFAAHPDSPLPSEKVQTARWASLTGSRLPS